jgi:quercetin dioxygenase-like cupin family protein
MNNCRIDFNVVPWETPMNGMRVKAIKKDDKQIRLVEFSKKFVEPDWCKNGHAGYILEGQLEIDFNGKSVVFNPGDALVIPAGDAHKHKAKTLTDVVRLFLVEGA